VIFDTGVCGAGHVTLRRIIADSPLTIPMIAPPEAQKRLPTPTAALRRPYLTILEPDLRPCLPRRPSYETRTRISSRHVKDAWELSKGLQNPRIDSYPLVSRELTDCDWLHF
jgi:hypothetical protein